MTSKKAGFSESRDEFQGAEIQGISLAVECSFLKHLTLFSKFII
jgi:hypothetical protein